MAVKYVKDFDYPSEGGFHKSKMPSRAMPNAPARGAARMESKPKMGKGQGYAKGGRVPGREMDKLPAKKPPGRMMDLAPSKPERGQYQGYAKGGKVEKFQRGGPSSREPTGPISKQAGYFPNPFGKSIRFEKGPSGGGYQRSYPGSRYVMDKNFRTYENPNYDPRYDESGYVKLEELREDREPLQHAKGGKVSKGGKLQKYAKGGKVQKYADGGYTRSGARAPTPQELAYAGRTRIPGAFPMPSELAALQQWAKSQNLSPTQYNRIVNQALRGSQKAAPSLLSRMGKAGALIGTGAALKGLYDEFTMPEDNSQLSPAPDEGMIERRRGGRVSKGNMSKMRRGGKY